MIVAELPENPGSEGSPNQPYTSPAPPPFQPVAPAFQPVATGPSTTSTQVQPIAVQSKSGGGGALKIILIVVAVLVVLVMMVVGVIGYGVWRFSRAVHVNRATGETTINTPGGTFSANTTEKFTADELGTDIYPGAQPAKGGLRMTLPTGPVVAANFLSSDSKDQVVSFYKNKFGSQAMTMDTSDGAILTLNKSKQDSVMLTITQKPGQFDGKTQIHIMHTINNKAS
jgi:hypothetical protein